ncbi:stage III sporulation protein AC [Eubacteriales bacterium mix99]|jgi:stage III sporulation protein AC
MDVDLIFKIAAIGILIAVINQVLTKAGREDMAMMTSLAGVIIVLLMIVDLISRLFNSVKSIFHLY